MAKDILSEYGPESNQPQRPRATSGGVITPKSLPYSPPVGPLNQWHVGPGLGGGTNHGNGIQDVHTVDESESGKAGMGDGERMPSGSERNPGY